MGLFDKIAQGMQQAKANDNGAELADGTELYIKQKAFSLRDNYSIYDANEQEIYTVAGTLTGLSFTIKRSGDGQEQVAEIKKKLVSITPSYDILFTNGRSAVLKKKMALLKEEFNGTVDGKELKLTGNVSALNFEVTVDGQKIGAVAKKILAWGDTYAIAFVDDSWKDIMVALAVAIDNACHSGQE